MTKKKDVFSFKHSIKVMYFVRAIEKELHVEKLMICFSISHIDEFELPFMPTPCNFL